MSAPSNLPPGCTDRDVERAQGADYKADRYVDWTAPRFLCVLCGSVYNPKTELSAALEHQDACEEAGGEPVSFRLVTTKCRDCDVWIEGGEQAHEDEEHR